MCLYFLVRKLQKQKWSQTFAYRFKIEGMVTGGVKLGNVLCNLSNSELKPCIEALQDKLLALQWHNPQCLVAGRQVAQNNACVTPYLTFKIFFAIKHKKCLEENKVLKKFLLLNVRISKYLRHKDLMSAQKPNDAEKALKWQQHST